jgi:predicted ATPase
VGEGSGSRGRPHGSVGGEGQNPELDVTARRGGSEGLACLLQALEVARQRGLLSLELRSGISLARLWADRGEADRALELLEPIFSRFSEGFQTLDLMAAAKLLAKLRSL